MRLISVNLNGIRAASRKNFFSWMLEENADVICIQETKAQVPDLQDPIFKPQGYHSYFHDAQKKGYSGVAIYSKIKPLKVHYGLGWPCADQEGRYVQADFKNISIASLYLPSGTSGEIRQTVKYDFLDQYYLHLKQQSLTRKNPIAILGDWNIAHRKIDLKNWRGNLKNSGFLPDERAWMDKIFAENLLLDAFRIIKPNTEEYTWWSYRARAWDSNAGWRIDYQMISPELQSTVKKATIYREQRFSDHAPLIIDYDWQIQE
jgi:exodeoxyribonuclease III